MTIDDGAQSSLDGLAVQYRRIVVLLIGTRLGYRIEWQRGAKMPSSKWLDKDDLVNWLGRVNDWANITVVGLDGSTTALRADEALAQCRQEASPLTAVKEPVPGYVPAGAGLARLSESQLIHWMFADVSRLQKLAGGTSSATRYLTDWYNQELVELQAAYAGRMEAVTA
jgi:hypothetical protein